MMQSFGRVSVAKITERRQFLALIVAVQKLKLTFCITYKVQHVVVLLFALLPKVN